MSTPKVLDLVLETSTNPGTGAFVLNGAPTGRRSFATALAEGGDVYYYAEDGSQAEWGVGALEVGAVNTLTRQTILGNTSAGRNPLNFTTEVRVYSGLPGDRIAPLNADGTLSLASPADEDDSETAPTTKWTRKRLDALEATVRQLVETLKADSAATYVKKAGDEMEGNLTVNVRYAGATTPGEIYTGGTVRQIGPYAKIAATLSPYDVAGKYAGYLMRLYDAAGVEHKFAFRNDDNIYTENGRLLNDGEDLKSLKASISGRVDWASYNAKVKDFQGQIWNRPTADEFNSGDSRVILLPFYGMIQSFKSGGVGLYSRINFPRAFSSVSSIACTLVSNTGQRRDVTIGRVDNGGFSVMSNLDGSELYVQAIGKR
ncbi:hypothetical protein CGLAMM_07200 [Acetobacteraceae bacterium EV16G]|uniref:Tail fiber protein n=1 Tax=Sorlinia euscelidii TaxID=3081148 RepID=A0ABU7U466_9PROT